MLMIVVKWNSQKKMYGLVLYYYPKIWSSKDQTLYYFFLQFTIVEKKTKVFRLADFLP